MGRDLGTRLTEHARVAAAVGTVVGAAGRALSTALHALAAGATWGAELLDERRLQPPGGNGVEPGSTQGAVVHYVAGEICGVVAADGLTRSNAPAFYAALWEALNDSAARLVKERLAGPAPDRRLTSFDLDTAPSVLGRLTRAGRVRQYVAPLDRRTGGERNEPWVLLEVRGGDRPTLIAFFAAARGEATVRERYDCVRELVNLVNADLERVNRELAAFLAGREGVVRTARLEAVTPNWLAAGTQDDFTDAGPGAAPAPAPAQPGRGHWQFQFDRVANRPPNFGSLAEVVRAQRSRAKDGTRSGVLVAILDTCPTRDQVQAMAAAHPENTLLQEVADPARVKIGEAPSLNAEALAAALAGAHGRPIKVNWREFLAREGVPDDDYLMTDHGLFAAGIVRDIAPTADVRLIRVLNDYGVGDLLSLTQAMSRLPALIGTDGITRIVVNLSLVADLPPDAKLLSWWFPRTSRDPQVLRERFGDVCRVIGLSQFCVDKTLAWLRGSGRNVLVVAAAGNDFNAAAGGSRPAPRLPARDDAVLGVAAVNRYGNPASYSNKGDFVVLGNGVATFGGDATAARSGDLPRQPAAGDAVVGLFTAPVFPLSTPPTPPATNASSWAFWAGTSFATPVVSGIAACLWGSEGGTGLSPSEVIAAVRAYAGGSGSDLDCPSIPAYQTFVTQ